MIEFTDQNFGEKVLRSDLPVLVDFWGSWCLPCKMMDLVMVKLEEEYKGRIKIGKMNIDRNQSTPAKYEIGGVPSFILFKEGDEVGRKVAAASIEKMREFIDRHL